MREVHIPAVQQQIQRLKLIRELPPGHFGHQEMPRIQPGRYRRQQTEATYHGHEHGLGGRPLGRYGWLNHDLQAPLDPKTAPPHLRRWPPSSPDPLVSATAVHRRGLGRSLTLCKAPGHPSPSVLTAIDPHIDASHHLTRLHIDPAPQPSIMFMHHCPRYFDPSGQRYSWRTQRAL